MESRVLRLVGVFALVLAAGYACGDNDDDGTGPDDGVTVIRMSSQRFNPATVTIDPGTTVRWVGDSEQHTITPETPDQPGAWERVVTGPGQDFEHTFEVPGETYDYFCEFHPGMTGRIVVREE